VKNEIKVCFAVAGNATIGKMAVDDCKASLEALAGCGKTEEAG
jgi:hypothetical protein